MAGVIGINRLTSATVRAFAKTGRTGDGKAKAFDGDGLFLTRTPAGTTVWRLRYRFGPDDRIYSLGQWPEISIEAARAERDAARALIRQGIDPVDARRLRRADSARAADTTFRAVAETWFAKNRREWSDIHFQKSTEAFERDVYPVIGRLPINHITSPIVAQLIERILARGVHDTAKKVHQHLNGVFRLAKARGLCDSNPAAEAREVIPRKHVSVKRPALLEVDALRDVLRRADRANISPAVRLANRLCAFTATRLGNVVAAEWTEFDLDGEVPTWTIPRRKMKVRDREHDHRIPLGPTIAAELRTWKRITGGVGYVFPPAAERTAHPYITRETVEKVYRVTLGLAGKHSLHGWRSSFSTLAKEAKFDRQAVDLVLDHVHDTATARAYDRGERMQDRVALMRWWDEQLAPPVTDATVLPIRPTAAIA
ncbi:MAG: tyrosine-type recombinase/integrase [Gemmatimonadales bacterium]